MSAHAFWATSGCQSLSLVGERVKPPCKHNTEKKSNCGYFTPTRPNECEHDRKHNRQESSHNLVCVAEWSVKPYGAECPGDSNHGREKTEQLTNPANHSHQILQYRHNDSRAQQSTRSTTGHRK